MIKFLVGVSLSKFFIILNLLMCLIYKTDFLYADQQESISSTDTEEVTETRRRKSCLNDFRQCARKTIENYDDKRGSNERACERWKGICKIHYPAIFKTIDVTTDYTVITKDEFTEFKRLTRENKKSVKIEKDGNKTITTTTELDEDGNEKITKTIETIEELENQNHNITIVRKNPVLQQSNKLDVIAPHKENIDITNLSNTNYDKNSNEEGKKNLVQIEINESSKNDTDQTSDGDNTDDDTLKVLDNSFNVENIVIESSEKRKNGEDSLKSTDITPDIDEPQEDNNPQDNSDESD